MQTPCVDVSGNGLSSGEVSLPGKMGRTKT